MKNTIITLLLIVVHSSANACPVCERNKPKFLQGITHGSNPQSNWDYVIVTAITLIVLFALFLSIKLLLKPNESNANHIKYSFLNEQ
ncbi:MAG: hypothetical protein WKF89_09550 [Chitinophagaceae bacterium]